ncbi:MAG: adenylyltransferase/cytidyltransferase family protein [Arenicellales bacterium]|nr:adenylyltransferase/cytidyltransferase family protein [Arenicellales bacterium]
MRVYVDVVADLFHYGHVKFFQKARAYGDFLLVGVHSDQTVSSYKRSPILSMAERITVVKGCRYVDEVIGDAPLTIDQNWIKRHQIDLVVHSDDLSEEEEMRMYEIPIGMGMYRRVQYTPDISTTKIIDRCKAAPD